MTESERSISKSPSRGEKVGVERSLPSILKMPGVERSHASMLNPNRHIAFGGNQFQEAKFQEANAQTLQVSPACGVQSLCCMLAPGAWDLRAAAAGPYFTSLTARGQHLSMSAGSL